MTNHGNSSRSTRSRTLTLGLALTAAIAGPASAGSADIDTSYAGNGAFQFPMSAYGARTATGALQPDGKLLLGGWAGVGFNGAYNSSNFAMTRFLPGSPGGGITLNDTSFGDGSGKYTMDLFGFSEEIVDMAHTDAGIYAIGFGYEFGIRHQVLMRFTQAGLPDPTFGSGGKILLQLGYYDALHALAVQPDGKLVAVGQTQGTVSQKDFFIVRFLADGSLDNGFGNGGKNPIIASYGNDAAYGVAVQPDGKLLVVGEANDGGQSHAVVLRLTSWGGIDYGFGTYGFARLYRSGVHLYGRKVLQTVEGKIIVGSEGLQMTPSQPGISIARLNQNGSIDTTFNAGAGSRFDIYAAGAAYYLGGMEMMPTGQIMAAGGVTITNSGIATIYTARYTEGGGLDTTYNNGYAYKLGDIGSLVSNPTSAEFLGVTPEGKVYVGGHSQGNFFALRYQGIPVDLLPNDVEVPGVSGVAPGAEVTSALFYVSGLSAGVRVPITISDGRYSRNGAPATAESGYVANGDWIRIVQTAAPSYDTETTTIVRIGGVSPSNNRGSIAGQRMTTSFTTFTASNPGGGASE